MKLTPFLTTLLAGIAFSAAGTALAQDSGSAGWLAERQQQWEETSANLVSADDLLEGDISNGLDPIASIDDLVLTPEGQQLQYVLFNQRGTYFPISSGNGFISWDNVDVSNSTLGDVDLLIGELDSGREPQELELTRAQANRRLVSSIIGSDIIFADGQVRPVDDLLFNPETGQLMEYVVAFDPDSLFAEDQRRIPASMVTIDSNGGIRVAQPTTYDFEIWLL